MNRLLSQLQPYPFERLAALKAGISPADKPAIMLSIGEPKHAPPPFVLHSLAGHLDRISFYPKTLGNDALRQAIAGWLERRFALAAGSVSAERQVLPLNGTREGIFAFVQAAVSASASASVIMPNPFYQIYEGAALLAGATPVFVNCTADNGYRPDFSQLSEQQWRDCQLLIICSPGNPTGAVMSLEDMQALIRLADRYDFIIASDECYSEIYHDEDNPPPGLLQACAAMGRDDFRRCVVFHSLSKRSNLPGLRSGFIAGDSELIQPFLLYRTYHGCAMAEPTQIASTLAWQDEQHVIDNRALYRRKFRQVLDVLDGCLNVAMPPAAFYLWPQLPDDDERFCQALYAAQNVTALPGQYLSRQANGTNPGQNHARLALVATEAECLDAAQRIRQFVLQQYPGGT
ncbi:MAG TPA: succinyldiaminopimelate transaminase [Pseudomonadales bacterium]